MISIRSERRPMGLRVAVLLAIFVAMAATPFGFVIDTYRQNNGCEAYFDLSIAYNFDPSSCLEYTVRKYIVPLIALAAPSLFVIFVLIFKEATRQSELTNSKQEYYAFLLTSISAASFGLSVKLIAGMSCEGFGCLGTAPLLAVSFIIFPPLVFGASLWFLCARYEWKKNRYLATAVVETVLLILAYTQTPLI